jgi:hypothetical protein
MNNSYNGMKIFSATKHNERLVLGETVTDWLRQKQRNKDFKVIDTVITQSSDSEFHCLAITVMYFEPL